MQIPKGSFTQFRLAGQGLNDDNLRADIMEVRYEMSVKGVKGSTNYGVTDTKFDVLLLEHEQDYNCYIEQSTIWLEHGVANMCDFIGKEGVTHVQVSEWSSSDSSFLNSDLLHNDVFVILDNTGWLSQLSNSIPKTVYHDVTFEMEIKSTFAANDTYN